jgi:hypothetical protein
MEVKISITTDSGEVKEIIRQILVDDSLDLVSQLETSVGQLKSELNGMIFQNALENQQALYSFEKKKRKRLRKKME